MSKLFNSVSGPSKNELIMLRLMILIGVVSTLYLLYCLFDRAQAGFAPFYWILMPAITFSCLRLIHEWYHYFSISVPREPEGNSTFTVDIFTTFCAGEPREMVEKTLEAIQQIRYPHTTYLCDEADDPYLKEVCRRLGVRHITRKDKKDAKAGNINNALQYASGDLCVILDPDHVPQPEFLDPIVPHFNDPKIGFVQIVQAYSNLDNTFIAKGAAQQTFQFYGPIMMTMNSYGTVLAIGANCTFRRAALDSIGGHAAGLAEDMHTAMQLHAKGWKSVYVPAVLARGLVPSTLSAYYAQQLKWSRGTFELFFTTFFRLFTKFSWRQKIHYGTIPLYYLSGFIAFINFMIPVLSLCTGLIPFRMDMTSFVLLGMPMIASAILIRHYVQRWVMEEKERGFHVVGGLLQIGTWWIYITGFVFTLIRKKVPYIPTPKDDRTPDSWVLYMPNLLVLLISISAIAYGLWYDWNPYSLVMACIAGINCIILTIVLLISLRGDSVRLRDRNAFVKKSLKYPLLLKRQLWLMRHTFIYSGLRKTGLLLLTLTVFASWYLLKLNADPPKVIPPEKQEGTPFLTGIYQPGAGEGLVSFEEVKQVQSSGEKFNIISLYIPWGDAPQCFLPDTVLQFIYNNGSLPMITWEPWGSLFKQTGNNELRSEKKIFAHIIKGELDYYLQQFSSQVKKLNRPVFIRFAHEPDNPAYPWSPTGNNTPMEYRAAWKYVYEFFLKNGVNNVVWVWNPWRAEQAKLYFPGKPYVDWLSVTALDYGPAAGHKKSNSFRALYKPFHQLPVFHSGIPVMIGEMGSLADAAKQASWFDTAFSNIQYRFPEIKGMIFFNTAHDYNVPEQLKPGPLNWQWRQPSSVLSLLKKYPRIDSSRLAGPWKPIREKEMMQQKNVPVSLLQSIKGVNYNTGKNWYRNFHELLRVQVQRDFERMKTLGISTIRRYGPGIYDHNVLAEARQAGMKMVYSFWIPALTGSQDDDIKNLAEAEQDILKKIDQLKNNESIIGWSVGNTNQLPQDNYKKPFSFYKEEMLFSWLDQLSRKIKDIDPKRPLSIDVNLSAHIDATLSSIRLRVPAVDMFGLIIGQDTTGISSIKNIRQPVFISEISPENLVLLDKENSLSVFAKEWQDQQTRDYVTFDGLLDQWGRQKPGFYLLQQSWTGKSDAPHLPAIKILRPSKTVFAGSSLLYWVLVNDGTGWRFADDREKNIRFEWRLLKTTDTGEVIYMQEAGTGPSIHLQVPENPQYYRLYVQAVDGISVTGAQSILNLPLSFSK